MFVCVCNAIKTKEIEALKEKGIKCERDLFRECGVTPQCGSCVAEIKQILNPEIITTSLQKEFLVSL